MTNFINNSNYKTIYTLALFTIFFFIAVSIVNMAYMISFHSQYAELINTSGKQRMLSQRITLLATTYNQQKPNTLLEVVDEFENNHKFLIDRKLSKDLEKIYYHEPHDLDELLTIFVDAARQYSNDLSKEELRKIIIIQNEILESLDKVVIEIQKESDQFSDLMVLIEFCIFFFIAVLLYLEKKYIFGPMSKRIELEKQEDKKFQEHLEKTVKQKTKKLQESLDIINHYVFTSKTDKNGIITYVSDAFCELTGYTKDELIGKSHSIIRHPDTPDESFSNLWKTITEGKVYQGEVKNRKKNGEEFWLSSFISPELDENGEIIGYTAYRKNITHEKILEEMNEKLESMVDEQTKELQENNKLLKKLSETDALTGIYNRKKLKESLELEIKKAQRYDEMFSIILLDVDHFKKVNDTYGHLKGDKVLVSIAKLISENIRDIDLFARWGGEEFVILLHNQDVNQTEGVALKLKDIIENTNIEDLNITCSFGVTQFKARDNSETIFKKADDALYKAKESGRNCVIVN